MDKKTRCEDCAAWEPIGNSGKGDCKRNPPQTFEQVLACWPQTMYNNGCYSGLPISKEPERLDE